MSASRTPTRRPSDAKRGGEVDRQRRLADAALAGGDGDHARRRVELDRPVLGRSRRRGAWSSSAARSSGLMTSKSSRDRRHALDRADLARDLLLERGAERTAGDGERDRHRHGAAVDRDVAHHVELGHRLAQLGIDHPGQGGEEGVARRFHTFRRVAEERRRARPQAAQPPAGRRRAGRAVPRPRGADPRARRQVERDRAERRVVDQLDREAALADDQLRGGEVDRARRLQADDRVGAAGGEVAVRERLRAHDAHAVGQRREPRRLSSTSVACVASIDRNWM